MSSPSLLIIQKRMKYLLILIPFVIQYHKSLNCKHNKALDINYINALDHTKNEAIIC